METGTRQTDPRVARCAEARELRQAGKFVEALSVLEALHAQFPDDRGVAQAIAQCWAALDERDQQMAKQAAAPPPRPAPRPKRRMDRRTRMAALFCIVAAASFSCGAIVWLNWYLEQPSRSQTAKVPAKDKPRPPAPLSRALLDDDGELVERRLAPSPPPPKTSAPKPAWSVKQASIADGIRTLSTPYGVYLDYIPPNAGVGSQLIVLVHGSPDPKQDIQKLAHWFISRDAWLDLADRTGAVLVAPCFDVVHFGGYRGLGGSVIGADEFLIHIASEYLDRYSPYDRRFVLYGHSAGGQFAVRFAVTHPARLRAVCLSAPGAYPWPDKETRWPNGMKDAPNAAGFLLANTIPVAVIVGDMDNISFSCCMGPCYQDANRIELGNAWVAAMHAYAQQNGQTSLAEYYLIPGIGHSSEGLTASCVAWLTR